MEFKLFADVEDDFSSKPNCISLQDHISTTLHSLLLIFGIKFIVHAVNQFPKGHADNMFYSSQNDTVAARREEDGAFESAVFWFLQEDRS